MFRRRRKHLGGFGAAKPDCKVVTFHDKKGRPKKVELCASHKGARKRAAKKRYAKNGLPWEGRGRRVTGERFYEDIDPGYRFESGSAVEPPPWLIREGYEGVRSRRRRRRRW